VIGNVTTCLKDVATFNSGYDALLGSVESVVNGNGAVPPTPTLSVPAHTLLPAEARAFLDGRAKTYADLHRLLAALAAATPGTVPWYDGLDKLEEWLKGKGLLSPAVENAIATKRREYGTKFKQTVDDWLRRVGEGTAKLKSAASQAGPDRYEAALGLSELIAAEKRPDSGLLARLSMANQVRDALAQASSALREFCTPEYAKFMTGDLPDDLLGRLRDVVRNCRDLDGSAPRPWAGPMWDRIKPP
jgi:hypothetical protein